MGRNFSSMQQGVERYQERLRTTLSWCVNKFWDQSQSEESDQCGQYLKSLLRDRQKKGQDMYRNGNDGIGPGLATIHGYPSAEGGLSNSSRRRFGLMKDL